MKAPSIRQSYCNAQRERETKVGRLFCLMICNLSDENPSLLCPLKTLKWHRHHNGPIIAFTSSKKLTRFGSYVEKLKHYGKKESRIELIHKNLFNFLWNQVSIEFFLEAFGSVCVVILLYKITLFFQTWLQRTSSSALE